MTVNGTRTEQPLGLPYLPPAEGGAPVESAGTTRLDPFQDGQDPTIRRASSVQTPALPPRLEAVKARIIELTSANTTRTDNIAEIRAELDPLVDELETWFAANRPDNEVELTQGAWRSLWYDDENIDSDRPVVKLDRNQIYQVVREQDYYNVSDNPVRIFGLGLGTTHSFLKGNYEIADRPNAENRGQKRLNVIDLEFDGNRLRFGKIPRGENLRGIVDEIDARERFSLPIPGPKGITGQLWNAYVDKDIRISRGQQDDDPGVTDMYILRRVRSAED